MQSKVCPQHYATHQVTYLHVHVISRPNHPPAMPLGHLTPAISQVLSL